MRRAIFALVLVVSAVGLTATTALAKEANVELSAFPGDDGGGNAGAGGGGGGGGGGLQAGQPWNATLSVNADPDMLAAIAPSVTIRNAQKTVTFPAKADPGTPGVYHARVVFPSAGPWTYEVSDGATGRVYTYPPVVIAAPSASAPGGGGDAFPAWPLVLALTLAFAVTSVLAVRARRSRTIAAH